MGLICSQNNKVPITSEETQQNRTIGFSEADLTTYT